MVKLSKMLCKAMGNDTKFRNFIFECVEDFEHSNVKTKGYQYNDVSIRFAYRHNHAIAVFGQVPVKYCQQLLDL